MVTVQFSPARKSASGSSVKVVGPPEAVAALEPLSQLMLYQAPLTSTGSLKVISMFAARSTSVAPSRGEVLATLGAASPRWLRSMPLTSA